MLGRKDNFKSISMKDYHDYLYAEDGVERKSELKFGVKSSVLLGVWDILLSKTGWGRNTLHVSMDLLGTAGKLSHNFVENSMF